MLGLSLVLLTGCSGTGNYIFTGTPVWKMFPFDGEREWIYVSEDRTLPYKIAATCDGIAEVIQGKDVYTVDYQRQCVGNDPSCVDETLFQLRWSSDDIDGVSVWAYDVGDGFVDFETPVQLTPDEMKRDDQLVTQTNGTTWTSTMLGIEVCPVAMAVEWDQCGAFEITAEPADGYPLAGKWWAVAGNGVTSFLRPEDSGQWKLADADCLDDNCDGDW